MESLGSRLLANCDENDRAWVLGKCCSRVYTVFNFNYQKSVHSCNFQPRIWVFNSKLSFCCICTWEVSITPVEYIKPKTKSVLWNAIGVMCLILNKPIRFEPHALVGMFTESWPDRLDIILFPSHSFHCKYGWFMKQSLYNYRLLFMTTISSNSLTSQM